MNVNDGTEPCPTCGSGMYRSTTMQARRAEKAEARVKELQADLLAIAEAVGVVYAAEGVAPAPGPTNAIVDAIRAMRMAYGRELEREEANAEERERRAMSKMTDDETQGEVKACPECEGRTVEFRFGWKNLQYRICTRWEEPGHMTKDQVRARIREEASRAVPPGAFGVRRFA